MNLARRRLAGGTAAAMLVSVALLAQSSVTSEATWNDTEWTHGGAIGTVGCEDPDGAFATRAEGRALSGSMLGIDLDSVAEAEGVTVTNNGSRDRASAGRPVSGLESAYADPLSVNALSAIQVPLTGLVELPGNNSTGVVGQFGQARDDGLAHGAAGYVTDSGGIDLANEQTGTYPDLATLKLSDLLNSPALGNIGLGDTLSGVSDLELEVGAVAAEAQLDGCASAWGGAGGPQARAMAATAADDIVDGLERRYLTASADLTFRSPAVGALVSAVGGVPGETCASADRSTVKTVECTVNGLASQQSVLSAIQQGVVRLLGQLTDELGLGTINVQLTATANLSAIQALLTDTLTDSGGVVTVDLSDGTVRISTDALLAAAYPDQYSDGLNGLPPNFNPFNDPVALQVLTERLTGILTEWVDGVATALVQSVKDTVVSANVTINLTLRALGLTTRIGHIEAIVGCAPAGSTPTGCTLGTLLDPSRNTGVTQTKFVVLPGLKDIPILGPVLDGLINGVVGTVIAGLVRVLITGLGSVVGTAVDTALGATKALSPTITALTEPVISTVSRLYSGLFLSNILSLTVNAQNDPASGGPPPPDWRPGQPGAPPEGQYEVAALRIGVLDGLGPAGVRLYLGRASVGPGCSTATSSQPESACVQY